MMPMERAAPAIIATCLVRAGCGTAARTHAPRDTKPQQARPAEPRAAAPRPDPASPAVRGKGYPECDPRARDADRGRVAVGLLASDCLDDAGRNGVYVTRLVTVKGGASPAQRAGLELGDRLVRVDACEIGSSHDLAMQLRTALPGWIARVYVERGGRTLDIFVPTVPLPVVGDAPAAHLSTAGCKGIGRRPAR